MLQIRDKKAYRKHIETMNPINEKACNSLSCTLLLIVYYLFTYRNHLTSSKVTYTVNQLVMHILVQIWAFYNDAF